MSFTISLTNQIAEYSPENIYWAILGKNSNDAFCYMNANGQLIPMTAADNKYPVGTATNCHGANKFANFFFALKDVPAFIVPDDIVIDSGQIWISLGDWLPICVSFDDNDPNKKVTGFAPPSITNPGLQGYDTIFQMAELTYNKDGTRHLNADTSSVDYMGFPVTMELTDASGTAKVGFSANRDALFQTFNNCPDINFKSLVISNNGINLRILSPEHAARDSNCTPPPPNLGIPPEVVDYFSSFYTDYINKCWDYYTGNSVTIRADDNSNQEKTYTGQVQNGKFNFYEGTDVSGALVLSLDKPQNWEVIQCAGELKTGNTLQMNIEKAMAAALYRIVFLNLDPFGRWNWCNSADYFTNEPINYYGKILHDNSLDGLCYAFAFDDVCNQSSSVVSTTTKSLVLTLPAWS